MESVVSADAERAESTTLVSASAAIVQVRKILPSMVGRESRRRLRPSRRENAGLAQMTTRAFPFAAACRMLRLAAHDHHQGQTQAPQSDRAHLTPRRARS